MFCFRQVFVLIVALVNFYYCKQLPSFLKPCIRNGQDLNECTIKVMNEIREELVQGIPSMGVPPMDPLTIPKMELSAGNGSNFNYVTTFTDMVFRGAKDFEIKSTDIDLDNIVFKMTMKIPQFLTVGHYDSHGRILLIDFRGDGTVRANMTGVLINGVWNGHSFEKNGKTHFNFDKSKVDINIEDIKFVFENIFKENPELTNTFNRVIDENRDVLYEEIKPIIGEAISQLITVVINKVYDNFSVDQLYPKSK